MMIWFGFHMKRSVIIAWMVAFAIAFFLFVPNKKEILKPCVFVFAQEKKMSFLRELEFFAGQGFVLINFWASWCAPCLEELPSLRRMVSRIREEGVEVEFIALSQDDEPQEAFLASIGLADVRVYYDEFFTIAKKVGVARIPVTVLLDKEGYEVMRYEGSCAWENSAEFLAQWMKMHS